MNGGDPMCSLEREIEAITADWLKFLRQSYNFKIVDDNHINVVTPLTDAFDDGITIMISKHNQEYTVSDQGYTLWNLESRGINISKGSQRQKIVNSVIRTENVKLSKEKVIFKTGLKGQIPQMIFDVTQAIIKVGNLGLTNFNRVKTMFSDDVKNYFQANNSHFNFITGMSLQGKSGLSYTIDYLFWANGASKATKVSSSLAKNNVEQLLGIWYDTEIIRRENQNKLDLNVIVPSLKEQKQLDLAAGLNSHGISVIPFDDKRKVNSALSIAG